MPNAQQEITSELKVIIKNNARHKRRILKSYKYSQIIINKHKARIAEEYAQQALERYKQYIRTQCKIFMEATIELIIKCGNKLFELMHTAPTEQNTILAIIARQWKYAMTYVQTCLQKASEAIDATKLQHAMTCAQTCLENISETIGATQALETVTQYMSSQLTTLMNMLTLGGSKETKPEKQATGGSEETMPETQPISDTTEQSTSQKGEKLSE